METMKTAIVLTLGMTLLFSGCANKAQTGGAGGAAIGAVMGQAIGHDTKATLLGAAIGGILGYMVGNEMDKEDRARLSNAYEYTPDHSTSQWVNPNTGNSYQVTPQRTWREPQTNQDCREVEILATIDGKAEKTYSTACRENDRWVMR
ncbi:MAG: glycine zipper domain-containing protein [Thermodesulfobacteriota bacterium]